VEAGSGKAAPGRVEDFRAAIGTQLGTGLAQEIPRLSKDARLAAMQHKANEYSLYYSREIWQVNGGMIDFT
jgi:hypothetical protein